MPGRPHFTMAADHQAEVESPVGRELAGEVWVDTRLLDFTPAALHLSYSHLRCAGLEPTTGHDSGPPGNDFFPGIPPGWSRWQPLVRFVDQTLVPNLTPYVP